MTDILSYHCISKMMSTGIIELFLVLMLKSCLLTFAEHLKIVLTDQTHDIKLGSEVRLTCVVTGGNDPGVHWLYLSGPLPSNTHIENNGMTLVFTEYRISNNGMYLCSGSDGNEFDHHLFTVTASAQVSSTSQALTTQILNSATLQTISQKPTGTETTKTTAKTTTSSVTSHSVSTTSMRTPTTRRLITIQTISNHVTKPTSPVLLPSQLTSTSPTPTGPICLSCKNVVSVGDCNMVTRCGVHEECYMQTYTRDGLSWYDFGCQNKLVCEAAHALGRRDQHEDTSLFRMQAEDDNRNIICEKCCRDRDLCNNGGLCDNPAFDKHGGSLCYSCSQQVSRTSCDKIQLCNHNQSCYMHYKKSHVMDTHYVWESGCTESTKECSSSPPEVLQSRCCKGDLCNIN